MGDKLGCPPYPGQATGPWQHQVPLWAELPQRSKPELPPAANTQAHGTQTLQAFPHATTHSHFHQQGTGQASLPTFVFKCPWQAFCWQAPTYPAPRWLQTCAARRDPQSLLQPPSPPPNCFSLHASMSQASEPSPFCGLKKTKTPKLAIYSWHLNFVVSCNQQFLTAANKAERFQ